MSDSIGIHSMKTLLPSDLDWKKSTGMKDIGTLGFHSKNYTSPPEIKKTGGMQVTFFGKTQPAE